MKTTSALAILGLAIAGASVKADDKWDISKLDVSKLPPAADKTGVTYANDIRPLFEASCFRCHGDDRPKGGLRLNSLEAVLKGGEDGKVVVPGDSKKSLLVVAAARINDETAMPPKRGDATALRTSPTSHDWIRAWFREAANVKDRPLAAPMLPIVLPADRVEDVALADPADPVAALALRRNLSQRNRSAWFGLGLIKVRSKQQTSGTNVTL